MMRFKMMFVLLATVSALVLTGCPSNNVKVLDDYPSVDWDKMGQDIVNFFTGVGDKLEIQVGDIIASAKDGGLLKKVVGVNEVNGAVQLVTTAVSLAEAIESGVLSGKINWTNADFEDSGAPLAAGGKLTIDLSGLTIFSQDGVSLSLDNGSVLTYAPEIVLDATFDDHKLTSLKMDSEGEFTADLTFKLAASKAATLNWETPIVPAITKPFVFYIGPVPVAGVASISFPFGVSGTVGAGAALTAGFSGSSDVKVGGSYNDGKWTDDSSFGNFEPVAKPVVVTLSSSGSLTCYVKVQPSLSLYEASTLSGYVEPYITAAAQFIPSPLVFDLYAGINGGINYNLTIFDFTLINKSWFFPGPQWQLYEYSLPYDIPTTFTFQLPL